MTKRNSSTSSTTKRMGRPPHVRSDVMAAKVKMFAAMGLTSIEIGRAVDLAGPTVLKYYRREFEIGAIESGANVAQSLYRAATDKVKPNVIACIFWLKCRCGWREDDLAGMGKKEMADLLSRVSDKGTDWDKLLTPSAAQKPAGRDDNAGSG